MTPFKKGWKYYLGMTFLVLSFLIPALGLIFPFLGLPAALAATLVGVFTIGIPEVMIILAVLCLGKEALNYYKSKIFKKKKGTPKIVSKFRYYFGLFIFSSKPNSSLFEWPLSRPSSRRKPPLYLNGRGFSFCPQLLYSWKWFWGENQRAFPLGS